MLALRREHRTSILVDGGRHDGFDERRDDGLGCGDVDRTIQPDNAAKGSERVGLACAHVGVGCVQPCRGAARIRVLDDDGGGL